jgi:hypothetical protein
MRSEKQIRSFIKEFEDDNINLDEIWDSYRHSGCPTKKLDNIRRIQIENNAKIRMLRWVLDEN